MGEQQNRRVAFVIGGSRGIGAAITRALTADGVAVAFTYLARAPEAEQLADELHDTGATVLALQADASDPAALCNAIDMAVARLGRLDILVNNAGLAIVGSLESYPPDAFDRVFAVNVRAPFLAAQKAASLMTDGGRIISIGSIVADRAPGGGATLYAVSKSALHGLTRGLARDLGARGITVNLVQPGPVDTERNRADGPNAEANRAPLAIKRHCTLSEVAGLIAFLASDAAAFIAGSVYNIDGGWAA